MRITHRALLATLLCTGCYPCTDVGLQPDIAIMLIDNASGAPVTDATVDCALGSSFGHADPRGGTFLCGGPPGAWMITVTRSGSVVSQTTVLVARSPSDHDSCINQPATVMVTLYVGGGAILDGGTGDATL